MQAIIVAGGKGERLRPLTTTIPKPMIPVQGKPMLEHIIMYLQTYGISEITITLCYLPEKITSYFGSGEKWNISIRYIYEDENNPLGTAGSITGAKRYIHEPFLVTYADIFRELDISHLIEFHQQKKGIATLSVYKRYGENPKSVIVFDQDKRITKFIERPLLNPKPHEFVFANASCYIFQPDIFTYIPEGVKQDFGKDIFPKLIAEHQKIYAYETEGLFLDIGNKEKLAMAQQSTIR